MSNFFISAVLLLMLLLSVSSHAETSAAVPAASLTQHFRTNISPATSSSTNTLHHLEKLSMIWSNRWFNAEKKLQAAEAQQLLIRKEIIELQHQLSNQRYYSKSVSVHTKHKTNHLNTINNKLSVSNNYLHAMAANLQKTLAELQTHSITLSNTIASQNDMLTQYRTNNKILQAAVLETRTHYSSRHTADSNRIKKQQHHINTLAEKCIRLENTISAYNTTREENRAYIQLLKQTITNHAQELMAARQQQRVLQTALRNRINNLSQTSTEQVNNLRISNQILYDELRTIRKNHHAISNQLTVIREENNTLQKKYSAAAQKNSNTIAVLNKYKNKLNTLHAALEKENAARTKQRAITDEKTSSLKEKYNKRITSLNTEMTRIQNQNKTLHAENKKLRKTGKTYNKNIRVLSITAADFSNRLILLSNRFIALQENYYTASNALMNTNTYIQLLKQENSAHTNRYHALVKKNAELMQRMNELRAAAALQKDENKQLHTELNHALSSNSRLDDNYRHATHTITSLQHTYDTLKSNYAALDDDYSALRNESAHLYKTNKQQARIIAENENKYRHQCDDYNVLSGAYLSLGWDNKRHQQQIKELKSQLQATHTTLAAAAARTNALHHENISYINQHAADEQHIAALKKSNAVLSKLKVQYADSLRQLNKYHLREQRIAVIQSNNTALIAQTTELHKRLSTLNTKNKSLEKTAAALRKKLSDYAALNNDYNRRCKTYNNELSRLHDETLPHLHKKYQTASNTIRHIQTENNTYRARLKLLSSEIEDMRSSNTIIAQKLYTLQTSFNTVSNNLALLEQIHASATNQLRNIAYSNKQLQHRMNIYDTTATELEKSNVRLSQSLHDLNEKALQLQTQNNSCQIALRTRKNQSEQLAKTIKKQRHTLNTVLRKKARLEKKVICLQENITEIKTNHARHRSRTDNTIKKLRRNTVQQKETIQQLTSDIEALMKNNEILLQERTVARDDNTRLKAQFITEQNRSKEHEEEIIRLKTALCSVNNSNTILLSAIKNTEISDARETTARMKIQKQEQTIHNLKRTLAATNAALQALRANTTQLENDLAHYNDNIESLRRRMITETHLTTLNNKLDENPNDKQLLKKYHSLIQKAIARHAENPGEKLNLSEVYKFIEGGTINKIPVLCYHGFNGENSYSVTPEEFEEQMHHLHESGWKVITVRELAAHLENDWSFTEKVCVITIDDGYRSTYTVAYPILKKYGFSATLFIYTDNFVGHARNALTWDMAREIDAYGIDIQCHTHTHPMLSKKQNGEKWEDYRKRITDELTVSKNILEHQIGHPIKYLAYPYGARNKTVIDILKDAGYEGAFTVDFAAITINDAIYELPRLTIRKGFTLSQFRYALSLANNS